MSSHRSTVAYGATNKALYPLIGAVRKSITPLAITALLLAPAVSAQDVTESALKAAFVYNFAKLTEWPADAMPASGSFIMCVVGAADLSAELERTVKGRLLAGRSIVVSTVPGTAAHNGCHVLYISRVTPEQAASIVASLNHAPVLTLSDIEGFTRQGGMAQFFFDNSQLRFRIREASATRARLRISSRLLVLTKRYD